MFFILFLDGDENWGVCVCVCLQSIIYLIFIYHICVCWFGRTSGYNTTCIELDFDSLISSNKVKDQRKRERNRIWKKKSTRWVIGSLRFFPRSRRFLRRIAPRKLLLLRPPSPLMSQRFEILLNLFFLFNLLFMCWK